ncbi:MAG: OsmC family peroxiredoxin [Paracoccaceae bacterium]
MIDKHATALWTGSLKDGGGTLTTQSGSLSAASYTFASRFETGKGANPEELIAAAHSGCFAMFLSSVLSTAGAPPERIEATATVSLDPASGSVVASRLKVTVKAPADAGTIRDLAEKAKVGCPISKLLKAEVTLDLTIA